MSCKWRSMMLENQSSSFWLSIFIAFELAIQHRSTRWSEAFTYSFVKWCQPPRQLLILKSNVTIFIKFILRYIKSSSKGEHPCYGTSRKHLTADFLLTKLVYVCEHDLLCNLLVIPTRLVQRWSMNAITLRM